MILIIWVALITLSLAGLALFVFLRNTKSASNTSFAIFAFTLSIWVMANFVGANFKAQSFAVPATYVDFFLGPILVYTLWNFTASQLALALPSRAPHLIFRRTLQVLAAAASLTVASGIAITATQSRGELAIHYSGWYVPYTIVVVLLAIISVWNLIVAEHSARGALRAQMLIMLWGMAVGALALLVANILVPEFTNSESVNLAVGNISYIGLVFFITLTAYAIVKHRLFDVRLVVARSAAYVLVLGVLVGLFAAVSLLVATVVPGGRPISFSERAIYTLLVIVAALAFPSLKRFFDRLTNGIFYQDAYDSQEVFNRLNKVLVSTIDLSQMLNGALSAINTAMKAEYCMVVLMEEDNKTLVHTVGSPSKKVNMLDMKSAHAKLSASKKYPDVIVTDELEADSHGLKRMLGKNDIAIVARLGTQDHTRELGHLILGYKKSGNPYTALDVSVIETISNELVIAVQNALRFQEIEEFNKTLQQKIDEKTRSLQHANDKLRKMDQTKDDFISMASHQLRTPLTSVKGYVSMVLDGDVGALNRKQRDYLNQVFVSSQRMSYLISDLLNVSRLRTGKFIIDRNPCNLANVIHEEVSQLVETAKARELELIYHQPEHFPTLMLDEMKMRQVIMNFIDNAIYYTPSGGSITVTLTESSHSIEFTVTDTGIGVPRAEQHHLFSKFFRAQNARVARPDGTGLGLFMAKKVVTAQGGAIIFKSREGKGSTFGFTMPKTVVGMKDTGPKKIILHS